MRQTSEKIIKDTISDILLDIEDIKCVPTLVINKGERNGVGYAPIYNIALRIRSANGKIIHQRSSRESDNNEYEKIIYSTIDRLTSYLKYEGFNKTHEFDNVHYVEIQYDSIREAEKINRLLDDGHHISCL